MTITTLQTLLVLEIVKDFVASVCSVIPKTQTLSCRKCNKQFIKMSGSHRNRFFIFVVFCPDLPVTGKLPVCVFLMCIEAFSKKLEKPVVGSLY